MTWRVAGKRRSHVRKVLYGLPHVNGQTKGAPGQDRPMVDLRNADPDAFMQKLRMAARCRVEGQSWIAAARTSGVPYNTLKAWAKNTESKGGKVWKAILDEVHAHAGMTPDGQVIDSPKPYEVTTEGFSSPEAFAEHWSLEATRIQAETMLDVKAPRKERLEAAKRIQDLGGHSPVSKSIVISAPIEDRRVAAALFAVLSEIKVLQNQPTPLTIEYQEAHVETV